MKETHRNKRVTALIIIGSLLLLLLVAFLSTYLATRTQYNDDIYQLYFVSKNGDTLIKSERRIIRPENTGSPLASALLASLLEGPLDSDLTTPFPSSLMLRNAYVDQGVLYVNLSQHYNQLTGYERNLANCCICLTGVQLENVYGVRISVNGVDTADKLLTANQFLTTDGFFESRSTELVLYHPKDDRSGLDSYRYPTTLYGDQTDAAGIVQILTERIFPRCANVDISEVMVHEVREDGDTVHVDLSREFLKYDAEDMVLKPVWDAKGNLTAYVPRTTGKYEDDDPPPRRTDRPLFLQSLIFSLTDLQQFTSVQFTFDGAAVTDFAGFDLSEPLKRGSGFVPN